MAKKRIFIDMDGTLANFRSEIGSFETLYHEDYYSTLSPHENVVELVADLCAGDDAEVFILSAVLQDSKYAAAEKTAWLDTFLPQVCPDHRIFVPCGADKAQYVPGGITKDDFLLDDYNKNLREWEAAGGTGIKLLNGINHTHGTWFGSCLNYEDAAETMLDGVRTVFSGTKWVSSLPDRRDRVKTLREDPLLFLLDARIRAGYRPSGEDADVQKILESMYDAEELWENLTGLAYPMLAPQVIYTPPEQRTAERDGDDRDME